MYEDAFYTQVNTDMIKDDAINSDKIADGSILYDHLSPDLINSDFNFETWDGFGYEMNRELKDYNYEEADKMVEYITFKSVEHQEVDSILEGKTFVITGKLIKYPNRQSLVNIIEKAGGKVQSSVSSKTQYLINNDINSTSAKNKKAKDLNIPIITEEDLERMMS